MDRIMRRKDRALSDADTLQLLEKCEYGVLSTVSRDGHPCATPLSYVVMDGAIYLHSAKTGLKIDNIDFCNKVCFCVVGATEPVYETNFTTYYESVLVYGTASKVEDVVEKHRSLMFIAEKYLPEHMDKAEGDITHSFNRTEVIKISMDKVTGKAKRKKEKNS